jgi:hypothetical protein
LTRPLRDALTAVSLANLCFLSAWLVLIKPAHYAYYNWEYDPGLAEFFGLVFDIVLLGGLLWTMVSLARLSRNWFVTGVTRWGFLALLVIPLNASLHDRGDQTLASLFWGYGWLTILFLLLCCASIALIFRWPDRAIRVATFVLLILSPLVLVNLYSTVRLRLTRGPSQQSFLNQPATKAGRRQQGTHVVWMIFDEMDQRLAFTERPSGIELPELDRLRRQALYARNSYPPAGATLISLPALVTGKLVSGVEPVRPNEMRLTFDDNTSANWSETPNIFTGAHELGVSTAVAGWYHPYCRVLGKDIDHCDWVPVIDQINPVPGQMIVAKSMELWARDALFTVPFAFRLFSERYDAGRREDHIQEYDRIMESARKICADPDLNLVMLHFPVPHHPWIYDRRAGSFSTAHNATYLDNLVLADHTLGEMRRALEAHGLWDNSTILVTSDHWWREAPLHDGRRDHRVPFLLKLPGQGEGLTYEESFNTVLIHDLLLDVLAGKVSTPDAASRWLDLHRSFSESPYTLSLP